MDRIVIAIDGYSGTGKSSTAKAVAASLKYSYIDSGAMYRCVTKWFLDHDVDLMDSEAIDRELSKIQIDFTFNEESYRSEVSLNGVVVEDEIRLPRISNHVSPIAAISAVRKRMVERQHEFGRAKGIVMDGRDIGTVVFPEAELKIFMTSDPRVRAERRQKELREKGSEVSLDEILQNLVERDELDTSRADSPLVKAADAVEVDTTHLTFSDQVDEIVQLANERINGSRN